MFFCLLVKYLSGNTGYDQLLKKSPKCFLKWLYFGSGCSQSSSSATLLISGSISLLNFISSIGDVVVFHCGFICISLTINDVENLFTCLLSSYIFCLVHCPFKSFVHSNLLSTFFNELSSSYWVVRIFIYSGLTFFIRYLNDEYFLLVHGSPFHFTGVFSKVEVLSFEDIKFINF